MKLVSGDLPARAELVVVGGGIVGAATAFHASRAGIETLLVERLPAAAAFTTAVATGGFRLQLEHREELALVSRSVALFEQFAERTGQRLYDPDLRPQGYLWLAYSEPMSAAQAGLVERQREWGVGDVELMSGDEARARWPWLPDSVRSARFRQRDGLIQPRRVTLGLLEGCDARVALGCDVTGFDVEGGRLAAVRTDRGTIACGGAVIAAGPLSGRVAELAGVELPVRPLRRQRVILWDAPEIPQDAPMTIDEETTAHWRPVAPGGAYVLFPDPAEPYAPPLDAVPGDPALALRLLDPDSPVSVASTGRFWNDLWQRGGRSWTVQAGQYTMTPDQRPLIGASEVDGLWVNTGYNGHGVMAGPGGAELLAGLIAGRSAESPFRLDRTFVEAHQAF